MTTSARKLPAYCRACPSICPRDCSTLRPSIALKPVNRFLWPAMSGDGCYRLEQGLLKIVITSANGDERILAILGPGEIAGELAIIDGLPRSASVFAIRDCELSFISRKDFEEYTRQHPDICGYLVSVLASRLREADETIAAASFMTVKARLARALLELAEFLGEDRGSRQILIHYKIKRNDLAAMAGVAAENVSRVMKDWMQRHVVTRSSGYYRLENIASLKSQLKVLAFKAPRAKPLSRREICATKVSLLTLKHD